MARLRLGGGSLVILVLFLLQSSPASAQVPDKVISQSFVFEGNLPYAMWFQANFTAYKDHVHVYLYIAASWPIQGGCVDDDVPSSVVSRSTPDQYVLNVDLTGLSPCYPGAPGLNGSASVTLSPDGTMRSRNTYEQWNHDGGVTAHITGSYEIVSANVTGTLLGTDIAGASFNYREIHRDHRVVVVNEP